MNVAAYTKIGLHVSLKPLLKPPHRQTQRLVSLIIQDEFQLTVMITHHRRGVESWLGVRSGLEKSLHLKYNEEVYINIWLNL